MRKTKRRVEPKWKNLSEARGFEIEAKSRIPQLDAVLMDKLRKALDPIDDNSRTALFERLLLPFKITNALNTARFLSQTLIAARSAQALTGVPASLLMAESHILCDYNLPDCKPNKANDWFGVGREFPSAEVSFFEHALEMLEDKRLDPVLEASGGREARIEGKPVESDQYLMAIGRCERWSKEVRFDLVHNIWDDGLIECDGFLSDEGPKRPSLVDKRLICALKSHGLDSLNKFLQKGDRSASPRENSEPRQSHSRRSAVPRAI